MKFHVAIQDFLRHVGSSKSKPCTPEQVAEIQARQGVARLPELYRAYLLKYGNELYHDMIYLAYPEVLEGKNLALALLAQDKPDFILPEDAFVFGFFASHPEESWEFLYFCVEDHPIDPPVYRMKSKDDTPHLYEPAPMSMSNSYIRDKFSGLHNFSTTFIPYILDGSDRSNSHHYLTWLTVINKLHKIPVKTAPKTLIENEETSHAL